MSLLLPAGSLERAARASGLRVVVLDGAETRRSAGDFGLDVTRGVLCHHTGSYDSLTDATDDLSYARWMAITGRSDLDPPLCNLALSAECVVYVCAYGNANHAGTAKASGPMPAGDGNELYVGIEAMNSGSQGWASVGVDADGDPVTQGEAYARLCAALCREFRWPADHVRAHRETSVTGKWDPGLLDMDQHRAAVARLITTPQEDDMFEPADRQVVKATSTTVEEISRQLTEMRGVLAERHKKTIVAILSGLTAEQRAKARERIAAAGGEDPTGGKD